MGSADGSILRFGVWTPGVGKRGPVVSILCHSICLFWLVWFLMYCVFILLVFHVLSYIVSIEDHFGNMCFKSCFKCYPLGFYFVSWYSLLSILCFLKFLVKKSNQTYARRTQRDPQTRKWHHVCGRQSLKFILFSKEGQVHSWTRYSVNAPNCSQRLVSIGSPAVRVERLWTFRNERSRSFTGWIKSQSAET